MAKREDKEFKKITTPDVDINADSEGDVVDKTQNIIQKYGTLITVVSLLVIVVAGALIYFGKQSEEQRVEAVEALSRVYSVYENEDYQIALNGDPSKTVRGEKVLGLIDIVNKYGKTEQGKLAALYAGNAYFALSDYSNAKKYFDKAISANAKLTKMGGNAGMAACLEKDSDYSSAAGYYEKAANLSFDNETKFRYMFFAGLNYEKSENKDKAIKLYEDIVLMNERSQFADEAKVGLARLGTVIE